MCSLARALLIGIAGVLPVSACSRGDAAKPSAPVASSPSASAAALDRLSPDEIAEGVETAFDLKIPRDLRVIYRAPDEVDALGSIAAERVANFVRKRVQVDGVELGAARTVFNNARVRGEPTGRYLRVEVIAKDDTTELVVKDLTPPRLDPNLTQEERWRKHGLDPNGAILDPTHLK